MSKTIIEVKCTDQVLTLTNTPVIASGGVGEDYVSIEFCDMWNDYYPSVIFWRKGVEPIVVLDDEETGLFQVPPQLMTTDGVIFFGVVGHHGEDETLRRTSEAISYRLEAGAINENTVLPTPTGDVFDQLMSYYAENKLYVAERVKKAEIAAREAGVSAMYAMQAAEAAQKAAEEADPVAVVNGIIYPGIVEAVLNDGNNAMTIPLSVRPPDKMFLTFRAPSIDGTRYNNLYFGYIYVTYPGADDKEIEDIFIVDTGYGERDSGNAIAPGDIVTVLLARVPKSTGVNWCYPLSSRINQTILDQMNQRLHPGIPASVTADGTMTVALDYVPEDKMVLVFQADDASSAVTKFQLEYETLEDGLIQVEYTLCDANNSPVESYGFYEGDYVVTLLTPADKRATVLNPRVTRDTLELVRGVLNMIPDSGGCEIFNYTGTGGSLQKVEFTRVPKVIVLLTMSDVNGDASAVIFKDAGIAKLKRVVEYGEIGSPYSHVETKIVSAAYSVIWDTPGNIIFNDNGLPADWFNCPGDDYIAICIA